MSLQCLECKQPMETRRSLHAHVKVHDMTLAEYYVKHFPKFDLHTREPIPFTCYSDYVATDFRNKHNMHMWLSEVSSGLAAAYCERVLTQHVDEHNLRGKFAPNHAYLFTHPRLPRLKFYKKFFDYPSLCEKLGFKMSLDYRHEGIGLEVTKRLNIWQDTREQQPLEFKKHNQVLEKLNFGDYALFGEQFNGNFVDRKSANDFIGTMVAGIDRFRREMERARHYGCYIFVVVESSPYDIVRDNFLKKRSTIAYVWENMRSVIQDYGDVCQFVFTGSRENSVRAIPALLLNLESRTVDIQELIEERQWLG